MRIFPSPRTAAYSASHGLMCLICLLCSVPQILQAHGVRQLPNCVRQRVWSVGQLGHRHAAGTGFDRRHRRVLGARRECRQSLVVVHAMMSEGDRGRWMLRWLLCWCLRPASHLCPVAVTWAVCGWRQAVPGHGRGGPVALCGSDVLRNQGHGVRVRHSVTMHSLL